MRLPPPRGIGPDCACGSVAEQLLAQFAALLRFERQRGRRTGKQTRHADRSESTTEHPVEPQGGVRIAVNVERPGTEARAIDILRRSGAEEIAPAEGEWVDGEWKDYDPRVPAHRTRDAN